MAKGVDSYVEQQATGALMRCCSPIWNVQVAVTTVKTLILCSKILHSLRFYSLCVWSCPNNPYNSVLQILTPFFACPHKNIKLGFCCILSATLISHTAVICLRTCICPLLSSLYLNWYVISVFAGLTAWSIF
jgi:hypothetical protein